MAPVPDRGSRAARVKAGPYLSVVVTARNDDHGGNLLGRMQAFVNGLLSQCARHRVPSELVMVEWNPPPERVPLEKAFNWSALNEFCEVRIIEVPPDVHLKFEHARALPLYQMIAKNVGIRRARGEFILATNIDILFSDELFEILAARALTTGKMYRADRWDVMAEVPADQPIERQLAWCNSHLLRVNRRDGTFPLNPDGTMKIDANDIVSPQEGISLGEKWFPREMGAHQPYRWVDNDAELIIASPGEALLSIDIEPGPGMEGEPLPLEVRDSDGAILASTIVDQRSTAMVPLKLIQPDSHIFLHTDYGGAKIASDLRTLNFRVFRCERVTGRHAIRTAAHTSTGRFARLRRNLSVVSKALLSNTEIRIPMSKAALARLKLKQDETGVAFRLGPLLGSSGTGDDVVAGGITAIWNGGWHEAEHFRSQTFRWMERESSITLMLPEGGGSRISFLVEAGPAVGLTGARVEVLNDAGEIMDAADLRGRTTLDVPAGAFKGIATLRLRVSGGGAPKPVQGDSRTLALRLLRCELTPASAHQETANVFEAAPGSDSWCVRGFKPRAGGLMCLTRGEMAVRAPEGVTFYVSPAASHPRLSIRDGGGNVLCDGAVSPGEQIAIPGAPGGVLLRFSSDRPLMFAGVERGAPDQQPFRFRVSDEARHPVHLHTNGCGDFTLMARAHWFDLRGYPELDAFSMNIDSVLCWAAHHGGAREEMLDARIFHIEHGSGSGWTPEGEQKLYQRILAKGLPWLDFGTVLDWARAMNRFNAPLIFNHEDWGLERETLRETIPALNACRQGNV
jgi:hypothetical protein